METLLPSDPNEFLTTWVEYHITAIPYAAHKDMAKQLVEVCIGQAAASGITRRELAAAAGGNLKRFIETALEDAWDAEVKKNSN